MLLISKNIKLNRILKVFILTLLFLIIFSLKKIREVNAVVCDLHGASTFCPVGYRTNPDHGCVAGFLPWPYSSKSVHGSHDDKDQRVWDSRYDLHVKYDFINRNIVSRSYFGTGGNSSATARPLIDLSSCLPNPAEKRITKFFATYHDASGSAHILGVDVAFRDEGGNEILMRDLIGNQDLHTCSKIEVNVTYDRNSTGISYNGLITSWDFYLGERYCSLGCKCCTPEERHLESHHQYECTQFYDSSHVYLINFTVPNGYRLYYMRHKFWEHQKRQSAQVWEISDVAFESDSISTPPTITVDKPPDCIAWGCNSNYAFTFNLRGSSSENGRDINRMRLNIGASTFNINISGSTATLVNTTSGNLTAQIVPCQSGSTACFSATEVLVQVRVGGLANLSGGIQVTASATNISGESSAVFNAGSFIAGKCPSVNFSYRQLVGSSVRVSWSYPPLSGIPTSCSLTCSPGTSCSCPAINCTSTPPPPGGIYNATCTITGQGSYNIGFLGSNTCGRITSGFDVEVGSPWLATGFGDTYAYGGYSGMAMQNMSNFENVPRGTGGQAYFSTYIISKLQSAAANAYPNRSSIRSYLLSNYSDNNVNLFTLLPNRTASVYDYIYNLAGKNGCFTSGQCTTTIPPQLLVCDSKKIYFVNDNLTLTNDFRSSTTVPDDACAFIVRRNVTVSSNITRLDGFFILDGNFITNSNLTIPIKQTLVIKGGVIANNVTFNRTLSGFDNSLNPSEIIIYDPKYIDLLRDLLGEDYPSKIRELEYSNPIM